MMVLAFKPGAPSNVLRPQQLAGDILECGSPHVVNLINTQCSFFLTVSRGLRDLSFPHQGLNPGHSWESAESKLLNQQGIPPGFILKQDTLPSLGMWSQGPVTGL